MYAIYPKRTKGGETVMDDGGSTDVGNSIRILHKFHMIS